MVSRNHFLRPSSAYLICATPRTGSTLLCDLLRSTGVAGIPREYFNRGFIPYNRARWRASTDERYYAGMMRHGLSPNGVFASKVMYSETRALEGVIRATLGLPELPPDRDEEGKYLPWDPNPEILEAGLPNLKYIWIRRADTHRQAISYYTAQRTKLWSWQGEDWPEVEVPDDLAGIAHTEFHVTQGDGLWLEWFQRHGVKPYTVMYEDLSADPAREAERVLDFLGLSAVCPPSPTLKKQAGARSEELYGRYLAALAAGEIEIACPNANGNQDGETEHTDEAIKTPA